MRSLLHRRVLGELETAPVGLGCMWMSEFYRKADEAAAIRVIHRAMDHGKPLLSTAPSYGAPAHGDAANEILVGKALKRGRDRVVLGTKCGVVRQGVRWAVDNSPARIRRSVDESLARLGVDHIDLYSLHRRDPRIPVEDVIGTMAELVQAGKVGHIGLSEVSADTLRQACAVHPIAALESEYSLLSRHLEAEILPTARQLGVGVVAYAPVGRALLTGELTTVDDLDTGDMRRALPRFQRDNLGHNLGLVDRLRVIADEIGRTPAQLSVAWLLAQGDTIVPLPSTTQVGHLDELMAAADIVLPADQLKAVENAIRPDDVFGARNTPGNLALMER
ncbi:aldo/keto reductase [Lentzea alba]|uniref:aldo/keto reductase n=1 Tax=Lentzea alba TaxID=2714351 RepID=UPI0039BFC8F9